MLARRLADLSRGPQRRLPPLSLVHTRPFVIVHSAFLLQHTHTHTESELARPHAVFGGSENAAVVRTRRREEDDGTENAAIRKARRYQ